MLKQKRLLVLFLLAAAMLLSAAVAYADGTVKGVVWSDRNYNGIFDEGERMIDGSYITLQKLEGDVYTDIKRARSADDGSYAFETVENGTYRLFIANSDNWGFSVHGLDSAALPAAGSESHTLDFDVNDSVIEKNIGLLKANNVLGIIAYIDRDQNGGRRNSEDLVRGVDVSLIYVFEGKEYTIATVRTTKSTTDYAFFRNITPGIYKYKATLPDNYIVGPLGERISNFYNVFPPQDGVVVYSIDIPVVYGESLGSCLGLVESGSLTGTVFDADENKPLSGVLIDLYSDVLSLNRQAVTDENGVYSFIGIQGGAYTLTASLPEGKMFAPVDSLLTQSNVSSASAEVSVTIGKTTEVTSIRVMQANHISVSVMEAQKMYTDENGVIVDDASVTGFEGVEFLLSDEDGNVLQTKTSGEEGNVKFDSLLKGSKVISVTIPEGYVCAYKEPATGLWALLKTDDTIVTDTEADTTEIVFVKTVEIKGMVYADANDDGIKASDDGAVSGMVIRAVDAAGVVRAETVSDEAGLYQLTGMIPSVYTVEIDLDDAHIAAPYAGADNKIIEQGPDHAKTGTIDLTVEKQAAGIDIGLFTAGTVSGVITMRNDHTGEVFGGVSGVTATLVDENGTAVSEFSYSVTDDNGAYIIKGVLPGTYTICYTVPANYQFSGMEAGAAAHSAPFSVGMASEIKLDELFLCVNGSFSGTALHQEEAIPVTITMTGNTTNVIYNVAADEHGAFEVENIIPDTYDVTITLPEGYGFGYGSDDLFGSSYSNSVSFELTVEVEQNYTNIVIDAAKFGSISGYLFRDNMNNGNETDENNTPAAEEKVTIMKDEEIFTETVTDVNGRFICEGLLPGEYEVIIAVDENTVVTGKASSAVTVNDGAETSYTAGLLTFSAIEGRVWNMDGSLNKVSNIPVTLMMDGQTLDTAMTNEEGYYRFDHLYPGMYQVAAEIPEGYNFARLDDLVNNVSVIYSDEFETVSADIILVMGVIESDADIGIGAMGSIGDYAWLDENGNGLQDIGEKQLPGIRIELYQYGEFVTETVTDEYGHWELKNLYPGAYTMRVTMPEEVKTTVHNERFPLVNSVLPESNETVVECEVIVPSGARDLSADIGFVCRKKGVYPASMKNLPEIDWSYNGTKEYVFE